MPHSTSRSLADEIGSLLGDGNRGRVRVASDDLWHDRRVDVAVFRKGGSGRDGINMWAGLSGGCFYVGEEHYLGQCLRVCSSGGGLPSFSNVKDAYENMIDRAADAAGIAIPALVIAALAYILAGLTLKPPTGIPI